MSKKFRSSLKTLAELDVDQDKIIYALNKSDLISPEEIVQRAEYLGLGENKKWIPISSVTRENVPKILELINRMLAEVKPQVKEVPKKPDYAKFYED